ncbi:MAG TPA: class I SAM-dependent methyltransferase [Bacteroidetes bacterium]|nr:class I SAM-dependent methyltransferase [Bacteroidota bacterium]
MKPPKITLRSPQFDDSKIELSPEISHLNQPFNGTIGSSKGDEYQVNKNIIELLGEDVPSTTIAQSSNFLSLTADAYEDYWRNYSIKLISGEEFSIEDEKLRISEWFQPKDGESYLDLGCSTALYARKVAKDAPKSSVVALDFSMAMLKKAREKALEEQTDLYLLQANAENLPFFSSTFDGITIGGTLNEFGDPVKALYEARRVLKSSGRMFVMYLLKADTIFGGAIQKVTGIGGIHFWNKSESEQLFERTGFKIEKSLKLGVVQFCLLKPV